MRRVGCRGCAAPGYPCLGVLCPYCREDADDYDKEREKDDGTQDEA